MTIVVPGAKRVTNRSGQHLHDKRGRPLWRMPQPSSQAIHWVNVGIRAFYEAHPSIVPPANARKIVPIYRGIDGYIHKKRQANVLRAAAGRWVN